MIILVIMS